ncbi:MAG TPA: PEP-CTERM sorting domain-containing protein [Smithellaceae bacterium]|jgi:hypothetical protein|nr:PEP-CTERM sorting domain-containing protein [Smithellaceae bacterium]
MKKLLKLSLALAVIVSLSSVALATPVDFTPNLSGSSVIVTSYNSDGSLRLEGAVTANLALSGSPFTLQDNETQVLDFFTLGASPCISNGNEPYRISATLAFLEPPIAGQATGGGSFYTVLGTLRSGTLHWDDGTLPYYFTLADGNVVRIDFEDDMHIGQGSLPGMSEDPWMVHAYVTNLGGAASAVPEPLTIMLLGLGLVGLAGAGRKLQK